MLAAALLNHADDEGYFKANPKLVQAACCPLREDSVSPHGGLIQLEEIGFVTLHQGSDGKSYGHIVKFTKHQKINRPTPSKIKDLITLTEDSLNTHGGLTEGSPPEQGTGNREQGVPLQGASPEKVLFDFGKSVLGKKSGGVITKLKNLNGIDGATELIWQASEKSDPLEWIGGVLRGDVSAGPTEQQMDEAIRQAQA